MRPARGALCLALLRVGNCVFPGEPGRARRQFPMISLFPGNTEFAPELCLTHLFQELIP